MAFTERKVIEIEWNNDNKGTEIAGRLLDVEVVQYKDGPGLVLRLIARRHEVKSFAFVERHDSIQSCTNPMSAK
jgi:hypothetical protein